MTLSLGIVFDFKTMSTFQNDISSLEVELKVPVSDLISHSLNDFIKACTVNDRSRFFLVTRNARSAWAINPTE